MSAVPQPAPESSSDGPPEIPPGIRRSQEAYWRDLPQLLPLRSRKREWVAYHLDERVAIGSDAAELYQECYRRGFDGNEIYVGRIEYDELPPWEPIDLDAYGEVPEEDPASIPPEALP